VIRPDGSRSLLAQGFTLYVYLGRAARNLERAGIPFKVVSFYREPNGREIENEIQVTRSRVGSASIVLFGTMSIWLGALTAFLTRDPRYVISIGVVGLCALAIVITKGDSSKSSGLVKVVSIIPSYVGGYALAVVVIRHLLR
jgi:hypothetical protein